MEPPTGDLELCVRDVPLHLLRDTASRLPLRTLEKGTPRSGKLLLEAQQQRCCPVALRVQQVGQRDDLGTTCQMH